MENGPFEKLVTELKAAWRGEQFGEQRDAVWAVFKDKVPRRHRTCNSIVDLVDILVDRGLIAPWDTRLLLRLSHLFPGIRQASGLVAAYNKVTAHRGNACTMCQGGHFEETPTTLALPSKSRHNQGNSPTLLATSGQVELPLSPRRTCGVAVSHLVPLPAFRRWPFLARPCPEVSGAAAR